MWSWCDKDGILSADDETLSPAMAELATRTNSRRMHGGLHEALRGADVFIGVSAPGILPAEWIADMAERAVVFALANPDPEVDPAEAERYAAVVASGPLRLPQPDQQRAGVPRRLPRAARRARARRSPPRCCSRRPQAIAHVVKDDELNPNFIIPTVFHPDVPKAVAAAIRGADT